MPSALIVADMLTTYDHPDAEPLMETNMHAHLVDGMETLAAVR